MSSTLTLTLPEIPARRRHWFSGPLLAVSVLLHGFVLIFLSLFGGNGPFGIGNGNEDSSGAGGNGVTVTWIPGGGGAGRGQRVERVDTVVSNPDDDVSVQTGPAEEADQVEKDTPLVKVTPKDPNEVFKSESDQLSIAESEPSVAATPRLKTRNRVPVSTNPDDKLLEEPVKDRQVAVVSAGGATGMALNPAGDGSATGPPGRGAGADGEGDQAGKGGPGTGDRRINFFGIFSRARKIVYVIDASESMRQHHAMDLAREKLWSSLQGLSPETLFQLVFFNLTNHTMNQAGERPKLLAATSTNLRLAKQFMTGIQPDSGTDRLAALNYGLSLDPDVIYLLTDADAPVLTPKQLSDIRRSNKRRAVIHVVEFGLGGDLSRDSFLKQLARENGGTHFYHDLKTPDR